jgi:hypothetical protein
MFTRIPRPSPALVVALIALFVALSGTAVAAGIVPHARLADNSSKLQGKTAAQVAALSTPLTSLGGYVTVKSLQYSINAKTDQDVTVACTSGEKAIGGGFDDPNGDVASFDSRPSPDGASWRTYLANFSDSQAATGNAYAICLR